MKRFFFLSYIFILNIVLTLFLVEYFNGFSAMAEECSATFTVSPQLSGSKSYEVVSEDIANKKRVYLGGQQIGFLLDLKGVMIDSFHEVDTVAGNSMLKSELKVGDIIVAVDGESVDSAKEVVERINNGNGINEVAIWRNGKTLNTVVNPLVDRISGEYRLGIEVKENLGGIGTVTYVKQDGRFGALGHCVGVGNQGVEIEGGEIYSCKVLGVQKGVKGNAGSVKGTIERFNRLGSVDKNLDYGIFGNLNGSGELYDLAKREEVVCGKAQIYSSLSGKNEAYEVEIVKAEYQPEHEQKGVVIKVTDKRLLKLTGGIIQGMSGSPIVQNGKIVGAVTHVFVNDPTRGYGIYVDWMIDQ